MKVGAVDVPGEGAARARHPSHAEAVWPFFLGFIVSTLLFADITQEVRGILIGSIIIVITGVIDDDSRCAWTKFLIQILAAVIAVLRRGHQRRVEPERVRNQRPLSSAGSRSR